MYLQVCGQVSKCVYRAGFFIMELNSKMVPNPNSLEDELRFLTDLRYSVIPFNDPYPKVTLVFEPNCANGTVGSYVSLSVCLSVQIGYIL